MSKNSKIISDMARLAGSAMGTVAGLKGEIETFIHQRIEFCLAKMQLVSREEFELVKEMAVKARIEQEKLAKRLTELENKKDSNE